MQVYRDPQIPLEQRLDDFLERLSEEELLQFLTGRDLWSWKPLERLGLPALRVCDGPHGVTCSTGDPAMSYPTGIGLASTWNTALIRELGVALGQEMHAKDHQILLGPAVDIHRAPKFGRHYEAYSEDPVLAGYIGSAWVQGVQSQGIGTTPKHLAAYATSGFMDDVQVDEQALREIYLKPFEIIIREAEPTGIMSSYNKINGVPTSEHPIQQRILKDEWGFNGFCISDWNGALDIACIENGMDIEMPGPGKVATPQQLRAAIRDGRLSWPCIQDAVRRIVRGIMRLGILDAAYRKPAGEQNSSAHQQLARRIACESMVLLKNENHLLPVEPARLAKLAVIGPNAATARLGGGGSAAVSPFYAVSPLDGLRQRYSDAKVTYVEGCAFKGNLPLIENEALHDLELQYFATHDISAAPVCTQAAEQIDHAFGWVSPATGVPKNDWAAVWQGELSAPQDGHYTLGLSYQDGGVRLWLDEELLIDDWDAGDADDFEAGYRDLSEQADVRLQAGRRYRLRIAYRKYANRAALRLEWGKPQAEDSIAVAARLAAEADVAICCVGLSNQFEGGGARRSDMELPGEQNRLIKAVLAANPKTVVVLIGGSPLIMEQWVEDVPAVIQAWYPGAEGGYALADIISGVQNPSGKLPTTLPRRYEDTPVYGHEDPVNNIVHYREGVFVGYRHYDRHAIAPRFAFGHGLSYTSFALHDIQLQRDAEGRACISGALENTGTRDGAEVIQVYAEQTEDQQRALRSLRAFTKVYVRAGERAAISICLSDDVDQYWNSDSHSWQTMPIAVRIAIQDDSVQLAWQQRSIA